MSPISCFGLGLKCVSSDNANGAFIFLVSLLACWVTGIDPQKATNISLFHRQKLKSKQRSLF